MPSYRVYVGRAVFGHNVEVWIFVAHTEEPHHVGVVQSAQHGCLLREEQANAILETTTSTVGE